MWEKNIDIVYIYIYVLVNPSRMLNALSFVSFKLPFRTCSVYRLNTSVWTHTCLTKCCVQTYGRVRLFATHVWTQASSILRNETGLRLLVSCREDHHHSQPVGAPRERSGITDVRRGAMDQPVPEDNEHRERDSAGWGQRGEGGERGRQWGRCEVTIRCIGGYGWIWMDAWMQHMPCFVCVATVYVRRKQRQWINVWLQSN